MTMMNPKVEIGPEGCKKLEADYLQAIIGLRAEVKNLMLAQSELFTDYESLVAEKAVGLIDKVVSDSQIALSNAEFVIQSIDEYRKFVEAHS